MEQVAEEAVNSWMDSPGHRENILNPQYITVAWELHEECRMVKILFF
jgi:hypothetical protein